MAACGALAQDKPPRNTQVQATRQFLSAALRGDTAAIRWLAPELRRKLGTTGVQQALAPLAVAGRRRGTDIELYKLGYWLEADGSSRPFVAYAWAADSLLKPKREWLQVAFRDSAARQVLEFELRAVK
ncbi:hypothetical protein Q5H93_11670 [Hymenobacter sp. ASUV-10]|uniref:Uncharacterized protein n=1 Tax=Hymenobacter aranciens TaxID=3063996 RepID=A0ABT9BAU1_9BACT|nr:hypothetical protein [Hymenobacter sp. ASUV-10]MDO7875390.1 hypothetical protein [Hymenobacter sp. ASUV-10]